MGKYLKQVIKYSVIFFLTSELKILLRLLFFNYSVNNSWTKVRFALDTPEVKDETKHDYQNNFLSLIFFYKN